MLDARVTARITELHASVPEPGDRSKVVVQPLPRPCGELYSKERTILCRRHDALKCGESPANPRWSVLSSVVCRLRSVVRRRHSTRGSAGA
jgi:hypothetical protein